MTLKAVLTGSFAALVLVGCSHAADEVDKKVKESEFKGSWTGPCSSTSLVSAAVGINSTRTAVDVTNAQGRTVQLFSDNACATKIGQATYVGTETIGGDSVAGDGARTLDLNYANAFVQIDDATAIGLANTLQTCGINDWAAGKQREVTQKAGDMNCAFTMKLGPQFDIIKLDGQTLFFGVRDLQHDAMTEATRPVAIDKSVHFAK